MILNDDNASQEEGWGWGPCGSEEDFHDSTTSVTVDGTPTHENCQRNSSSDLRKSSSEKSFSSRKHNSYQALKGIASSPSFQELEKAIGVALSQSSTDENSTEAKSLSPSTSFATAKLSSTNLMQQKVMQHRVRQQHQQHLISNGFQNQRLNSAAQLKGAGNAPSTKIELASFINESESRALILFHSPTIPQSVIRDVCSKYGVLYYIRPEFHMRGVTFLSYFDLQSALSARESIPIALGTSAEASVFFSIMLHATTSNTEEYRLVVKSLLDSVSEVDIQSIFSRYGQLRSIQKTFGSATDLCFADSNQSVTVSYSVEFYNIQDARLAASELSATSSNLWGVDASVRFAPLDERKKQLCKQLLGVLSRWRSEISPPMTPIASSMPFLVPQTSPPMLPSMNGVQTASLHPGIHYASPYQFGSSIDYGMMQPLQAPMLVPPLNSPMFHAIYNPVFATPYTATFLSGRTSPGVLMPSTIGPSSNMTPMLQQQTGQDSNNYTTPQNFSMTEYHDNTRNFSVDQESESKSSVLPKDESSSSSNARQNIQQARHKTQREGSQMDFNLDIKRIADGLEQRTTVMVRNIPNKYTQQMLLEEVNQNHSGTYDFFYLPIDFKNRCNVGYCFINFLSPQSIPAFVEEFHGQKWKSFNSEKVCAVSFARIQGKQAMIARFQNSSLMDKVDEYKPLLFYSSGPNIGKPEPFPIVASRTTHQPDKEHHINNA